MRFGSMYVCGWQRGWRSWSGQSVFGATSAKKSGASRRVHRRRPVWSALSLQARGRSIRPGRSRQTVKPATTPPPYRDHAVVDEEYHISPTRTTCAQTTEIVIPSQDSLSNRHATDSVKAAVDFDAERLCAHTAQWQTRASRIVK